MSKIRIFRLAKIFTLMPIYYWLLLMVACVGFLLSHQIVAVFDFYPVIARVIDFTCGAIVLLFYIFINQLLIRLKDNRNLMCLRPVRVLMATAFFCVTALFLVLEWIFVRRYADLNNLISTWAFPLCMVVIAVVTSPHKNYIKAKLERRKSVNPSFIQQGMLLAGILPYLMTMMFKVKISKDLYEAMNWVPGDAMLVAIFTLLAIIYVISLLASFINFINGEQYLLK